jgi:hypothetical protein
MAADPEQLHRALDDAMERKRMAEIKKSRLSFIEDENCWD